MSIQNCSFYSTTIYKDTSLSAKQFQNKFKTQVDPILQRSDKYTSPEPPKRKYAQNYFDRMKEKEISIKVRNNPTHQGSRIFEQSDPNVKVRNAKKHIDAPKRDERNRTQLKMFPTPKGKVGNLLKSENVDEHDEFLEKKESLRVNKNQGKPSDELVRMNNKLLLLPCELEDNFDFKINRASNRLSHSLSTKDRIFFNYDSNLDENKDSNQRRAKGKENPNYTRSNQISELITYKDGPRFRDDNLTDKPTRAPIRTRI